MGARVVPPADLQRADGVTEQPEANVRANHAGKRLYTYNAPVVTSRGSDDGIFVHKVSDQVVEYIQARKRANGPFSGRKSAEYALQEQTGCFLAPQFASFHPCQVDGIDASQMVLQLQRALVSLFLHTFLLAFAHTDFEGSKHPNHGLPLQMPEFLNHADEHRGYNIPSKPLESPYVIIVFLHYHGVPIVVHDGAGQVLKATFPAHWRGERKSLVDRSKKFFGGEIATFTVKCGQKGAVHGKGARHIDAHVVEVHHVDAL